jgi:pSer/pThr/pTyr-binding forkhead associated (FHA) protein
MRLTVKQGDQTVKEFQFAQGPIYIGRQSSNHVHLPDSAVSKRHAAIINTEDGKWMVEDLGSANKTYLNDEVISKAEIKTGDCLRITDFILEISLEETLEADKPAYMEDTLHLEAALTTPRHETIIRKPDAQHAPAMRLAAKRLTDFSRATEKICQAGDLDELLLSLLDIIIKQFSAYRCWCALRKKPAGPMTCHAGKRRDGQEVQLDEIKLHEKITQAVEKGQSLVLPRVSAQMEEKDRIRSAMIASIMCPKGCCGVLYVDNSMVHEHYSLSDLDYLMLLAMHTAAVLGKL